MIFLLLLVFLLVVYPSSLDVLFCLQSDHEYDTEESSRSVPQTGQDEGSRHAGGMCHKIPQTGTEQTSFVICHLSHVFPPAYYLKKCLHLISDL